MLACFSLYLYGLNFFWIDHENELLLKYMSMTLVVIRKDMNKERALQNSPFKELEKKPALIFLWRDWIPADKNHILWGALGTILFLYRVFLLYRLQQSVLTAFPSGVSKAHQQQRRLSHCHAVKVIHARDCTWKIFSSCRCLGLQSHSVGKHTAQAQVWCSHLLACNLQGQSFDGT